MASGDSQALAKVNEELKREIKERVRTEKVLKESEERYRTILEIIQENSPDIIYCLDPEGRFTFLGGALKSLLGYTSQDLMGRHFQSILRTEDLNRTEGRFNERRTGNRATRRFEVGLVPKTKDLERKDLVFEIQAIGVYDEEQPNQKKRFLGTYGVARDITDTRRVEEQLGKTCRELQETRDMLLQSEKLAAVGRLMAGVAQEILNPVHIITAKLQILQQGGLVDDKTAESLLVCEKQVERITKILDNLSHFSRVPREEMALHDVNEVVRHVLNLHAPQMKREKIQLEEAYDPALPQVTFSRSRMEQAFFNIISNAVEAMSAKEKRVLTVTTSKTFSGDYGQVIISDTGTGIDIQNMSRIFDPFFSTKKQSERTGLGLFLAYGIVKDHGGRIWAENNEAGGASFFVDLPLVRQKQS